MTTELFNLSAPGTTATARGVVDSKLEQAILAPDLGVQCPMTRDRTDTTTCWNCGHFQGLGRVQINGEASVWERHRVMCNFPKFRKVGPSTMEMSREYCHGLEDRIRANPDTTDEHKEAEVAFFLERNIAINCPMAKAKKGQWRIENPPCPACPCYKGLADVTINKDGDQERQVACGHLRSITLTQQVRGSLSLVEG